MATRKNFPSRKAARQESAQARQAAYDVIVEWEGFLASYYETEMIYAMERRMGA